MIFEGRRAPRRVLVGVIGGVLLLALASFVLVFLSVTVSPSLPALAPLAEAANGSGGSTTEFLSEAAHVPVGGAETVRVAQRSPRRDRSLRQADFLHSAFIVQGDPESVASLRTNLPRLQIVFPDWMNFANEDGKIDVKIDPDVAHLLKTSGVRILPRVSNTDAAGNWFEDGLPAFFRDSNVTEIFVDQVVSILRDARADGINLDIEGVRAADAPAFVRWLDAVAGTLHERGFAVTVDVPLNDDGYDLEAIGQIADAVVLMAYDQHYPRGTAGPIAARSWFEDGVADVVKRVPIEKLIVGLGSYGYDWTAGEPEARSLTFGEAMALAAKADVRVETDKAADNSFFCYTDRRGRAHEVWLLDAVAVWNQYLFARQNKVRGVALWRTGPEDSTIWSFYGNNSIAEFDPETLDAMPAPATVTLQGAGEIISVRSGPQDGVRALDITREHFIDWAGYTSVPGSYQVERFGSGRTKQVSLTFDDGPDPYWTPRILRVLAKYGVRATFFVVGDQAQRYPDLVVREAEGGHLIGNHTFYHRDLRTLTKARLRLELNSTERLIEAGTGVSPLLFRAPYDTESAPTQAAQLAPLREVDRMGYVVAAAGADSRDYERPGTDAVVANVLGGLQWSEARIVVFHDAGGDRQQTVEALDKLIPMLKTGGYNIVPLNELIGVPAAALMPAVKPGERFLALGARIVTWVRRSGAPAIVWLFGVTTLVSILRIAALGALVRRRERLAVPAGSSGFEPDICVLIPAFNEVEVIGRTLESVLRSEYRNMRVVVIDDGSTDETAEVVRQWATRDHRVSLISQQQAGKAAALNRGLRASTEDIIITIDADTIFPPDRLRFLVEPLADPSIDAVCGNVQVGNVHNILTAFQSVEYVTSQNYDRRAFDSLNCISVVPGATGAWRRAAVCEVGGYSADTLTEDADLTLAVLGNGGRITYAPHARSVTEAPETVPALFRQRFRWSFGTLQCMWKHRRQFGKGTLGWVALPNMFLFQILFPLLAPIGDAILFLSLLRGDFSAVAAGYIAFLAMDVIGSGVALHLDRRPFREIWVVALQRFFYRPLLYLVTFSAVLGAIRGQRQAWNKLKRMGSVAAAAASATVCLLVYAAWAGQTAVAATLPDEEAVCAPAAQEETTTVSGNAASAARDTDKAATSAFNAKQFLRAVELAPEKYPELAGLGSPDITVTSAWRTRSGTDGTSRLNGESTVTTATVARGADSFALRVDTLTLDAGTLGSSTVIGSAGPRAFLPATSVTAYEPTLSWREENAWMPHVEIGTTPANGAVAPTLQGRAGGQFGEDLRMGGEIYRVPVTDSILSMTGMTDQVDGKRFGRVVESGGTLTASKPFGTGWSIDAAASLGIRTGQSVESNRHFASEADITYDLRPKAFDSFTVSGVYGYEQYERNLGGFVLGDGGYYSPQGVRRAGVRIEFWTKEARDLIVHFTATPAWQSQQIIGEADRSGAGVDGELEAVYRLAGHWSLGAVLHTERTVQYLDLSAGLALRYGFTPRKAMLSRDTPALPFR